MLRSYSDATEFLCELLHASSRSLTPSSRSAGKCAQVQAEVDTKPEPIRTDRRHVNEGTAECGFDNTRMHGMWMDKAA